MGARLTLALGAALLLLGCGSLSSPSTDGGTGPDAGTTSDGGVFVDGGSASNAPDGGACGGSLVLCPDNVSCATSLATCPPPSSCPAGESLCPATATFASFCADLAHDPTNCGSCGRVCTLNQACVLGTCQVH